MKVLLLLSKWLEQVYPRWVGPLAAGGDSVGLHYLEFMVEVSVHLRSQNQVKQKQIRPWGTGHLFQKDFYLHGLIFWAGFLCSKTGILKHEPLASLPAQ